MRHRQHIHLKAPLLVLIVIAFILAFAGGILLVTNRNNPSSSGSGIEQANPSEPTSYSLNISSGIRYPAEGNKTIKFSVIDNASKTTITDFDSTDQKPIEVTIIREDLSEFRHLHPTYDDKTGEFTISNLDLIGNAPYVLYIDFVLPTAEKDVDGTLKPTVVSEKIEVGDLGAYIAQPALQKDESTTVQTGLYEMGIVQGGNDGGGSGFTTGASNRIAISISKSGTAVKNIDNYFGSLGHMVIFDENHNYIRAKSQDQYSENQFGIMQFDATFPRFAKYKLFVQTQVDGKPVNGDFTIKTQPAAVND